MKADEMKKKEAELDRIYKETIKAAKLAKF
jgi:hypothetical protein